MTNTLKPKQKKSICCGAEKEVKGYCSGVCPNCDNQFCSNCGKVNKTLKEYCAVCQVKKNKLHLERYYKLKKNRK